MKKRWFILIALMLILGISAGRELYIKQQQTEKVNEILDHQQDVNKIIVLKNKQEMQTIKGLQEAQTYAEPTPLAKIETLERKTKKKFEKEPAYEIDYYYGKKKLYEVSVLKAKKEATFRAAEKDFMFELNGANYMLVWQPYKQMLSQHDATVRLLQYIAK